MAQVPFDPLVPDRSDIATLEQLRVNIDIQACQIRRMSTKVPSKAQKSHPCTSTPAWNECLMNPVGCSVLSSRRPFIRSIAARGRCLRTVSLPAGHKDDHKGLCYAPGADKPTRILSGICYNASLKDTAQRPTSMSSSSSLFSCML